MWFSLLGYVSGNVGIRELYRYGVVAPSKRMIS